MSTDLKISVKFKDVHFNKTSEFFKKILDEEIHSGQGLSAIRLAKKNLLELLSWGATHPEVSFSQNNTLLSFRVGDQSTVINTASEVGFVQVSKE